MGALKFIHAACPFLNPRIHQDQATAPEMQIYSRLKWIHCFPPIGVKPILFDISRLALRLGCFLEYRQKIWKGDSVNHCIQ